MAYSSGFNPHPRISYAGAAPTGSASEAEYLEIGLAEVVDPARVAEELGEALPDGLDLVEVVESPGGSLADLLQASRWQVDVAASLADDHGGGRGVPRDGVGARAADDEEGAARVRLPRRRRLALGRGGARRDPAAGRAAPHRPRRTPRRRPHRPARASPAWRPARTHASPGWPRGRSTRRPATSGTPWATRRADSPDTAAGFGGARDRTSVCHTRKRLTGAAPAAPDRPDDVLAGPPDQNFWGSGIARAGRRQTATRPVRVGDSSSAEDGSRRGPSDRGRR